MFIRLLIALMALGAPATAWAQGQVVGRWVVQPLGQDGCLAGSDYGNHLMVAISVSPGGTGIVSVTDDRWTFDAPTAVRAELVSDGAPAQQIEMTRLERNSGGLILLGNYEPGFDAAVLAAKGFTIRVESMDFEQRFELDDAPELFAALRSCR